MSVVSVMKKPFTDFLVAVNDGSTDNSLRKIFKEKEKSGHFWKIQRKIRLVRIKRLLRQKMD